MLNWCVDCTAITSGSSMLEIEKQYWWLGNTDRWQYHFSNEICILIVKSWWLMIVIQMVMMLLMVSWINILDSKELMICAWVMLSHRSDQCYDCWMLTMLIKPQSAGSVAPALLIFLEVSPWKCCISCLNQMKSLVFWGRNKSPIWIPGKKSANKWMSSWHDNWTNRWIPWKRMERAQISVLRFPKSRFGLVHPISVLFRVRLHYLISLW